jgi:hypothetical protein
LSRSSLSFCQDLRLEQELHLLQQDLAVDSSIKPRSRVHLALPLLHDQVKEYEKYIYILKNKT